jgi:hypothetical protein
MKIERLFQKKILIGACIIRRSHAFYHDNHYNDRKYRIFLFYRTDYEELYYIDGVFTIRYTDVCFMLFLDRIDIIVKSWQKVNSEHKYIIYIIHTHIRVFILFQFASPSPRDTY